MNRRNPYLAQGLDRRQARRARRRAGRCQIIDVDGQPVRVQGNLNTPEDHATIAEIVTAAGLALHRREQLLNGHCPTCGGEVYLCTEGHTDGRGDRYHCRAFEIHNWMPNGLGANRRPT